ncbi:MAG: hypothetical protein ACUZ8O_12295, partial [Candidatus Anammoxibacter sp.]
MGNYINIGRLVSKMAFGARVVPVIVGILIAGLLFASSFEQNAYAIEFQPPKKFLKHDPFTVDQFGAMVSISGDKALVGARKNSSFARDGVVNLFDATTGELLYNFTSPLDRSLGATESFGVSAFISGNNVLIGAASGNLTFSVVYLFDATTGGL